MQNRPQTPPNPSARIPGSPRRRKTPLKKVHGVKEQSELPVRLRTPERIRDMLKHDLELPFDPDEWQYHLVHRILMGYDSFMVAATGLGKSLMFEGVTKLGRKKGLAVVVCPLKALERDQVEHVQAKGLHAVMVNEDTVKTPALWEDIWMNAQLVYLSPEMALSDAFHDNVWKDTQAHSRLCAIFVDEAHCVDEWGNDKFCPYYRQLAILRSCCYLVEMRPHCLAQMPVLPESCGCKLLAV